MCTVAVMAQSAYAQSDSEQVDVANQVTMALCFELYNCKLHNPSLTHTKDTFGEPQSAKAQ